MSYQPEEKQRRSEEDHPVQRTEVQLQHRKQSISLWQKGSGSARKGSVSLSLTISSSSRFETISSASIPYTKLT